MNKLIKGQNDLETWCVSNDRTDLLSEWNYDRNDKLLPNNVVPMSHSRVWWICKEGHEWEATIAGRTHMNSGCPYCSGRVAIIGENDLQTKFPAIAGEWHPTKNGDLKPQSVKYGSSKVVWWRCKRGHEWKASIDNRTSKNGTGCPYCAGNLVISGETDLQTRYPEIAKEWHPTKNGDLKPTDISARNGKKVWWQCDKGHEYYAAISHRTGLNSGCPYCSGNKVMSGISDLQTKYPEVVKYWNYAKNEGLIPNNMAPNSKARVWWICEKGHEWSSSISNCVRGTRCPICANKKVLKGYNDLSTRFPDIAKEWHPTKNDNLNPSDVTSGSGKKVWWLCNKGHEYQVAISHRTISGGGCPYCSGRYPVKGETDLQTKYPDIAKEWHPTKNGNLKPSDVTIGSGKRVWWICDYGHEWRAAIGSRTGSFKTGCPKCSGKGTSMPEQGIAFYLEKVCTIEQRIKIAKQEIDVYLPEYRIGIEYDGQFYHTPHTAMKETAKDAILSDNGIKVIRIKESNCNLVVDDRIIKFNVDYLGENYEWALSQLFKMLCVMTGDDKFNSISIDVENDALRIRERLNTCIKENSIAVLYPNLTREWHYEKNGSLSPDMFTAGSEVKVWWKCSKGHEWQALVGHRAKGHGCPYCNGGVPKRVINTDTGEIFNSMREAADVYGIKSGSNPISLCCLGKQKTAGGYHWRYVD